MQNPKHGCLMRYPATRWQDAIATGSGVVGALLYGRIEDDKILINHDRLYASKPRQKLCDVSDSLPQVRSLIAQTRYAEAAGVFASVMVREPAHRRAAFGYARALHADGHRREAAAAWRRYLELDGTSSWAAEARRHLRELSGG